MTYRLEHASVSRSGHVVLQDVCLTLSPGRVTGVIGPNGVGKSTLLAALAGDLKIDQGQALLDDQSIDRLKPSVLARRRAVLAQQAAAIFNLTVRQVLALGLHAFAHWSSRDQQTLLEEVAQVTGAAAWFDQSITALSMGQQQRVHFTRALLQARAARREHGSAWLLLDEPTASQDPWQQQMMMSLCRGLAADTSTGVLVVMHDLTLAAQWCDEVIVLKDKGVLAQGKTKEVLTRQTLKHTYGNELDVCVMWQPVTAVIISADVGG